jgi:hypothetical protein
LIEWAWLGFFGEGEFEADAEALGFFQLDVAADLVHSAHDVFEAVAEAVGVGRWAGAGFVVGVREAAAVVGDGDMQIAFLDVDVNPGIVSAGVF